MTTPARGHITRLLRALGALIVLVAVVGGVPLLMTALHLVPHSIPSLHELRHDLTSRDDGQLAAVVIAAGVWICWALFTVSLIPEIFAAVRKRPSYALPGLGWMQRPTGGLVAAVAIGLAIVPLITSLETGRAAAAPPPLPGTARPAATAQLSTPPRTARTADETQTRPNADHASPGYVSRPANLTYEVRRRDTLWQIATDYLGDPMRYTEIVTLNQDRIGPDNTIWPGMQLVMPADATGLAASTGSSPDRAGAGTVEVTVQPGDTLAGLAQKVTGSQNWHDGWVANRGRVEPDGEHYTDPDLIKPGWTLSIPTQGVTAAPHITPTQHRPAPSTPPAQRTTTQQPGEQYTQPTPTPAPTTPPGAATTMPAASPAAPTAEHPARSAARQASTAASEDRFLALTVGGGLLAATTFATLMASRRRKFRHRRPGHVVAPLPPDLMPLEQTLAQTGRPALAKMTFLDLALRDLANRIGADPNGRLPDIVGTAVNDDYLELYLAAGEDAAGPPPQPWLQTDQLRWTLGRGADIDTAAGQRIAPYPCLVSVGYTADGTEYLLDLEHVGALHLTGDPDGCLDLARYMVAELANNRWSDHLTVTVAGFGPELIAANPTRLAYTDDAQAAAEAVARLAAENREVAEQAGIDVLAGRLHGTAGDVWMPHVLLAAPGVTEPDVAMLRDSATAGRAAVAVVLNLVALPGQTALDSDPARLDPSVQVTSTGSLITKLLPVGDLLAFGLPEADAPDLARAIALDRDGTVDEPAPRSSGHRPCDEFADAAGALLPEYTLPRAASGPAVIDPDLPVSSSVLPAPDEAYMAAAATTVQDLAALAPAVTAETRVAVENADPELDVLLAAWYDPNSRVAKLRLLGPVSVTAYGRTPAKQEDFCTEIVTYLWHHPRGVSTDKFANDLWPTKNYSGTDSYPKDMASRTRQWLAICPLTGKAYLPRARRDGVQGYCLDGTLLSDVDLFRRLRTRGQARGADGLADLVAALDLVSGTPLSQLRPFGWGWLPAGEELLYQGMIAEVAHLVITSALTAGDDATAVSACERALQFNDEDDWALVQLTKAHQRAGRDAEKNATILRLAILEDPSLRTLEIMRHNGWLSRGA